MKRAGTPDRIYMDLGTNGSKALCWKVKTDIFKLTPANLVNSTNSFHTAQSCCLILENKEPEVLH